MEDRDLQFQGSAPPGSNAPRGENATMSSSRILIVDDDSSIRMLLRRLLESHAAWEVCEASNGAEAVEKAVELAPDLVILDLAMPGMNGLQAAREISKANPRLPLLLASVEEVSIHLARLARDSGFRGAVTKSKGTEVVQAAEALFHNKTFFAVDESLSV
jgi:CheY-like chemotaxis protein